MVNVVSISTVLLSGSREAIVRILNRAFWVLGPGHERVSEDDSIETINRKIIAANEELASHRTAFTLMDYLDLQSRINSPFENTILSYIDEEDPDGSENYDANPVEVTAEGDEYTLKIVSSVREGQRTYDSEDWHYWCAMISISDACLISIKKDNG